MPDKSQQILDAAANLFARFGYDKTTVSDIAKAAGISKGAIYLHFESKEALFEALLFREMAVHRQHWLELIEADPQGGTIAGMYKNVLYALNRVPFMSALFRQDTHILGSYLQKPNGLAQMRMAGSVRHEFVKLLQQVGAARDDLDANAVAQTMNLIAFGLTRLNDISDPENTPTFDVMIETIGDILERGLAPPGGSNSEAGKAAIRELMEKHNLINQQPDNKTESDEDNANR